jgi:hypothetical protein
MSMLVWVMMGIALWHFTVWFPDHFWGGIVGAFLAATIGSVVFSFVVNGFTVPGRHDTHIIEAFIAVPGALLGLGLSYWYGMRQEQQGTKPTKPARPARSRA